MNWYLIGAETFLLLLVLGLAGCWMVIHHGDQIQDRLDQWSEQGRTRREIRRKIAEKKF